MIDPMENKQTTADFGYTKVSPSEKTAKVKAVFSSVAEQYDLMNDLMSLGLHRLWKRFAVQLCAIRPGFKVLDLAGGSGDLTARLCELVGDEGQVVLADINSEMLQVGKKRLIDRGLFNNIECIQANAEELPFAEDAFDCIIIGFGLRNVTDKEKALRAMYRVLKPGRRAVVLEFSKPTSSSLQKLYDAYSFKVLPKLGEWVAQDPASYRYLAESIRMHPDQDTLKQMMLTSGFDKVDVHNLTGGIVAVHRGYKY